MRQRRTTVFPVGQGTLIYTISKKNQFTIFITPDKQEIPKSPEVEKVEDQPFDTENYISLTVGDNFARFKLKMHKGGEEKVLKEEKGKSMGIEFSKYVSYWFSYDRNDLTLKYGKGHVMTQTTLLEFSFLDDKSESEEDIREKYKEFFNAGKKKYVVVESEHKLIGRVENEPTLQFHPDPLVTNYAPFIKDSSQITLFDLDRDQFMFSSSLPSACRELYDNIKGLQLEYPENPITKLSDAIRYSINTPGMILYEKLKEKDEQFAYLRVTLGPDRRTAPGIPYVLEIWPSGKGSPIHNHGGACAIIKVLFGRITCNIYNKIPQPPEETEMKPLTRFDLKEEQITWISPNWYQTHRLHNNTDDFCATIQCYRYDFNDAIHWPDFDYVGSVKGKAELEEFFPDSDFTFIHLRRTVLDEYHKYLEG